MHSCWTCSLGVETTNKGRPIVICRNFFSSWSMIIPTMPEWMVVAYSRSSNSLYCPNYREKKPEEEKDGGCARDSGGSK